MDLETVGELQVEGSGLQNVQRKGRVLGRLALDQPENIGNLAFLETGTLAGVTTVEDAGSQIVRFLALNDVVDCEQVDVLFVFL